MILSRLVNPRASRMADMQASVPELVIRTFFTLGTSEQMSFAIVTSRRIRNAEAGAVVGGFLHGGNDARMSVAKNGRPPSQHVINVFIAVHVPNAGAPGSIDKERLAADGAKCANRRIHAARNIIQRLGEKLFRFTP